MRKYLNQYAPEGAFDADETALLYKVLPDRTITLKDDPCVGGERSEERAMVPDNCSEIAM